MSNSRSKKSRFHKGSVLKGLFAQQGQSKSYPMEMTIAGFSNGIISGTLSWPAHNGKSKFKGKIQGEGIYFSEYEVVAGKGISIPNIYEGKVVDNSISGICRHANEYGTFHIEAKK